MVKSVLMDLVGSFPATATNALWILFILVLLVSYVSTYLLHSSNNFGKITRYLVEYGKSKSQPTKIDLPKR